MSVQIVQPKYNGFNWTDGGTVSITATTSNPTKSASNTVDKVWYCRVGPNLFVRSELKYTTAGTAGTGDYLFLVPGGFSADTAVINAYATVAGNTVYTNVVGNGYWGNAGPAASLCNVVLYDATHVRLWSNADNNFVSSGTRALSTSNQAYVMTYVIPISTWTSYGS